jgi:hypothetical protein
MHSSGCGVEGIMKSSINHHGGGFLEGMMVIVSTEKDWP